MSPLDKDFEKLLLNIKECQTCSGFLPHGCRPVVQIHPSARILIAGQAPGIRVHETGIPFNDPSGKRLRDWLGISEAIFYNPEIVAILPMGFCYPGTGKNGDFPPRPECAKQWREKILAQLPQIELTIAIGQYAINWHLGDQKHSNLTKTVHAWQDYHEKGIIPLPHPSPRNNIWLKKNPWFEKDVIPSIRSQVRKAIEC